MRNSLSSVGVLKNRMRLGNTHGTGNCSLASRDLTVHLSSHLFQTPPAAWISSTGAALSCKQVSPGHGAQDPGSFQDDKPRQRPGTESSGCSTGLHPHPPATHRCSCGHACQAPCTSCRGHGPCLSPGAPVTYLWGSSLLPPLLLSRLKRS